MAYSIKLKHGGSLTTNDKISCYTFNLSPLRTCRRKPCFGKGCYALGGVLDPRTGRSGPRYKSVTTSWDRNWSALQKNPLRLCVDISNEINKRGMKWFRWLSAGDLTPDLTLVVSAVAGRCPGTKFLVFTKEYELGNMLLDAHKNVSVIFSTWPGWKENDKLMGSRHAIVVPSDGTNPRGYFTCPGGCEGCRECWKNSKKNIAFNAHGPFKRRIGTSHTGVR